MAGKVSIMKRSPALERPLVWSCSVERPGCRAQAHKTLRVGRGRECWLSFRGGLEGLAGKDWG